MKTCEYCGKKFDQNEARETFENEHFLRKYDNFTKILCGECAIKAIDDMDDVYLEECEKCGKKYDPFGVDIQMQQITKDDGASADMFDMNLCLDCALDAYNEWDG